MFTIELGQELEEQLECFAKQAGKTKESYAEQALKEFLEDREDYLVGVAALENDDGSRASLSDLVKELDLEHRI